MAERILWAIVGGFLVGVFLRSIAPLSWPSALFLVLLSISALAYALYDSDKRVVLAVCAVALVACGGGMLRMDAATQVGDRHLDVLVGERVTFVGVVAEEPDIREKSTRLTVRAQALDTKDGQEPISATVLVIGPAHSSVRYGDTIRAQGELRLPEAFDSGEGRVFDYPDYLARDGVLYQLAFASVEVAGDNVGNPIKKSVLTLKRGYSQGLSAVLPEPEAGLAAGITVGDKRSIGEELSAEFQRVSLIHMVVLSGYNITVVLNAIAALVSSIGRSAQLGAGGAVVLFFILMTGGAASAVRAGAMALLAVYARMTGRTFLALRVLGVVCVGMVVWNPWTLVFDPGFQLSVLATLGLVLLTPLFAVKLSWMTERFGLREIVSSTLGTQCMVLPLLLYQNGNLSLVALPANLLALVPVPFAMATSLIAALGGMVLGGYAVPLALPAYVLLGYIIFVAHAFASLPFAAVSVPAFSAWWLIVAYGAPAALAVLYKKRAAGTSPAALQK